MDFDSQAINSLGLQFDKEGMLLPHSILGNLEDFRDYLKAKGETELIKRIPESVREPLSEITCRFQSEAAVKENSPDQRNRETNALHHWDTHTRHRRRQQNILSDLLDRPVENLLMSQADHYVESREERELLNRALPLIQPGYGHRVGSEFWSLPERFGDELSGFAATLTQAELGRREPMTHVGLPDSTRKELGRKCGTTRYPFSHTQGQRLYLQHQMEEIREVLCDQDVKKPDISKLEVIGSSKPSTFVAACQSSSEEMEEKEKQDTESDNEIPDPLENDPASNAVTGPALRFCGQLATWTGNSATRQAELGINGSILFETLTGKVVTSSLELCNEGSTVIFFNWQKLPMKQSFAFLQSQRKKEHFYFNSLPGVLSPGETKQVEFMFKSEEQGIKTEMWQLNTHPLLLEGASMQVTLRGVALYQDKMADQRLFLQTKLEKLVKLRTCESILEEVLQGVRSPERPSSPAELYITKEQRFQSKNPKLQYVQQPVHDLETQWQEVSPGDTWNFSVDTLRQAVLSLPDEKPSEDVVTREQNLAHLNSILLQLPEPFEQKQQLTAITLGKQLARNLLDSMSDEAVQLRSLLGLPQSETWTGTNDESVTSETELVRREEEHKKKGEPHTASSRSKSRPKSREALKGEGRMEKVEESRKHRKSVDALWKKLGSNVKHAFDGHAEDTSHEPPSEEQVVKPQTKLLYKRLLHKKVYALMEDFVDNLCDVIDEVHMRDEQDS